MYHINSYNIRVLLITAYCQVLEWRPCRRRGGTVNNNQYYKNISCGFQSNICHPSECLKNVPPLKNLEKFAAPGPLVTYSKSGRKGSRTADTLLDVACKFYGPIGYNNNMVLTRHRRRDRVVVLRAERVVYFDFFRKLLDGETGQTAAAEFFRRRRVHLHVARGCQYLLADVQHAAGNVQVIVRNEIAAHFARPSDALLERRACKQTAINTVRRCAHAGHIMVYTSTRLSHSLPPPHPSATGHDHNVRYCFDSQSIIMYIVLSYVFFRKINCTYDEKEIWPVKYKCWAQVLVSKLTLRVLHVKYEIGFCNSVILKKKTLEIKQ